MAAARARVPKQVGRYQLVYELGASYLGPLWAARIEGGDTLALLRLVSLARLDADARVRLLEAAWQAMEVRDDRVLPVTDVVASDGELSVVSEYAEGVPLRAMQMLASVRRKPMSVPVALRFILDLADGVSALHRAMAELGDEAVPLFGGVSADSVLIGADGRASLLDVAIASAASSVESFGGTPERAAYAAPEQLAEKPRADERTDVFAVGTLAWELLANRRLFVGSDKVVAQKVLAAKVPKLEDAARKGEFQVPQRLGAAVLRALSVDAGARFESMDAFRKELESAGVAPAEPPVVATYVAAIADGALARTREALSLPPARAEEAKRPLPAPARGEETKPAPARAKLDAKPALPSRAAARPNPEARPPARTSSNAKLVMPARSAPAAKPAPMALPSAAPSAQAPIPVATSKRVSIEPKPGDGWRALDAPPPSRSAPPAKIRPRQQTMIGLPAPAGLSPSATPPKPPTEPPPSSGSSEEPTGQYSREHLKQIAELHASPPSAHPPAGAAEANATPEARTRLAPSPAVARLPDPPQLPSVAFDAGVASEPVKLVSEPPPALADTRPPARDVQLPRLVSLRPTPRVLSELHTERPPPPEPEPVLAPTPPAAPAFVSTHGANTPDTAAGPARIPAGLPPAPEEPQPVRIAAPPTARLNTGGAFAATASMAPARSLPPHNAEAAAGARAPERPAFSRPPPATVAASFYPTQVAPPLVHDPRANRSPSVAPPRATRSIRGIALGVAASLALVALSAIVALSIMTRRGQGATPEGVHTAAASTRADSVVRRENPTPAAIATTAPVAIATASATATSLTTPESTAAASAEPAAAASAEPAAAASAEPAAAASAPSRAPVSRAPRAAHKQAKKHGRFVPSDI